jgi:hypothetical protein
LLKILVPEDKISVPTFMNVLANMLVDDATSLDPIEL